MANSKQSLKRARQSSKRNKRNTPRRTRARTLLKKTYHAIHAGDTEAAQSAFSSTASNLDRLVNKGLIHKNKAARHKRRLNSHIKKAAS